MAEATTSNSKAAKCEKTKWRKVFCWMRSYLFHNKQKYEFTKLEAEGRGNHRKLLIEMDGS